MWILVVFYSLTQDKFDIVPVCALARVSFTYLHTTIPPQMKFLATPLTDRLEEGEGLRRGTVEDRSSVSQQRQTVKQTVDGEARLMNRKYDRPTRR